MPLACHSFILRHSAAAAAAEHLKCKELLLQQQRGTAHWGGGVLVMRAGGSRRKDPEGSPPGLPAPSLSFPFCYERGRHLHSFAFGRCVLLLYRVCFAIAELWLWNSYELCTKHKDEESASPPTPPPMFGDSHGMTTPAGTGWGCFLLLPCKVLPKTENLPPCPSFLREGS